MKNLLISYLALVTLSMFCFLTGCETDNGPAVKHNSPSDEQTSDPEGMLIKHDSCKSFDEGRVSEKNEACIIYRYYDGVLYMWHTNAGFNCCPGDITADIDIHKNIITIAAVEKEAGCRCNCLFDLEYEIKNITPGKYRIIIIEQYLNEGDKEFDFEIDIEQKTSDEYCLPRHGYPWD